MNLIEHYATILNDAIGQTSVNIIYLKPKSNEIKDKIQQWLIENDWNEIIYDVKKQSFVFKEEYSDILKNHLSENLLNDLGYKELEHYTFEDDYDPEIDMLD